MTLEEAQQKILELTDEVENLKTDKEVLTTELEEIKNTQVEKDNEIERLREHNNVLWKRCSAQTITPVEPPKPENGNGDDNDDVEIIPLEEIIADI